MKEKRNWTRWIFWFSFGVGLITIYKLLDNFTDISNWLNDLYAVLLPFIMGTLIALLLYVPCEKIEDLFQKLKFKERIARLLSVLVVYLIVILLTVLVFNIIIPSLSSSIGELVNNADEYYAKAMEKVETLPENSILTKDDVKGLIEKLQSIDIKSYLTLDRIITYVKSVVGIASAIFSVFVTIIVSIYILLERKKIVEFFQRMNKALFQSRTCEKINTYFSKSINIFFRFVSSQVVDGFLIGTILSIILLIMKVKYAVLLGFMIGICNLIPFFGAIAGVAIATIITIFTGGLSKAIIMLIIVIIIQQLDANIINPRILGKSLKISPILVIFSVTVAGAYFGVLGMFLSVPVATIIKMLIDDNITQKLQEKKIE